MAADQTDWIAVDWGTTNVRTWVFGASGELIAEHVSDKGMGSLTPDRFETALIDLVDDHLRPDATTTVICCGMVGARQGWIEAAYAQAPCPPPDVAHATIAPTTDPRLAVRILPGVSQAKPADVMRGEETQIAGLLAHDPQFDGVLCLPGTHTKWVRISAGEIVSFQTFMTGELYSLLSTQSVLRHSVGDGWDADTFTAAIDDAIARPQSLGTNLFNLRAEGLLNNMSPAVAKARLSGLLVGLELAGARPYWLGQRVALIGAPALMDHYERALTAQGATPESYTGDDMVLAGLTAARASLKRRQHDP